ncbi:TPA: hypothetical protein M2Q89_003801 [Escherichia coli]|nr:hypothetical protein [Escherichia coli]
MPDEWPLEFRDGVAIGRHEPEPERTNYSKGNINPGKMGKTVWADASLNYVDGELYGSGYLPASVFMYFTTDGDSGTYTLTSGNVGNLKIDGSVIYSVLIGTASGRKMTLYADEQRYTAHDIAPASRLTVKKESERVIGRYWWLGLRQLQATLTVELGGLQAELGEFATSPILTDKEPVTRQAASVCISTESAEGCRVIFSNGDTEEHPFPEGATEFTLPLASRDRGERYIQRIEYITRKS